MRNYRILIADDEPVIRMDLKAMLESMGHEIVAEAADGSEALSHARTFKPDLAILDVMMPALSGLDVAEQMAQERIAPVLILTAYSEDTMIESAAQSGVLGYLAKPFRKADLEPAIQLAVRRYREMQALEAQIDSLLQEKEARSYIGRARRALAARLSISQEEAFRRMQNRAQTDQKSLLEIAEAILLADGVIQETN